jgi:hypothetical protein
LIAGLVFAAAAKYAQNEHLSTRLTSGFRKKAFLKVMITSYEVEDMYLRALRSSEKKQKRRKRPILRDDRHTI